MESKCEASECDCCSGSSSKECCENQQDQSYHSNDRMGIMLCVAKSAKMELLKEKIKKRLESTEGKKLDKLADFLVESMLDYRKSKIDMIKRHGEMREKFESIIMGG